MSADEAFIRAIVDNPGDDTPRLVYADWLDDHDDPRGPYLRAEHEWAATHDPSERETLRQLAKQLDPVWVARVSRPPVGVCCDRLRFNSSGSQVDAIALNTVEERLKLSLSLEHRALLLNYNGGKPTPCGYRSRLRNPDDSPDFIDRFYGVSGQTLETVSYTREQEELEYTTKVLNNGFVTKERNSAAHQKWMAGVREFVTLAEPAGGLGVLAIGVTGRRAGKVYAINRTVLSGATSPRVLAESLPEFLVSITEQLANYTN